MRRVVGEQRSATEEEIRRVEAKREFRQRSTTEEEVRKLEAEELEEIRQVEAEEQDTSGGDENE